MIRLSLIAGFLILSSVFLAGCFFQNNAQVSPAQSTSTEPAPSIAPVKSASPSSTLSSPSDDQSNDEDSGLAPVQGDQVDEGEEVVQ